MREISCKGAAFGEMVIRPGTYLCCLSLGNLCKSQLQYRVFLPTTGCSAPVPRIGTPILTGASRLDRSLLASGTGTTSSHVPCSARRAQGDSLSKLPGRRIYPSVFRGPLHM